MHFGLRYLALVWPIRAITVEALISALLERSRDRRVDLLADALSADVSLAYWSFLTTKHSVEPATTFNTAAQELSERLSASLAHLATEVADTAPVWDELAYCRQLAVAVAQRRHIELKFEHDSDRDELAWSFFLGELEPPLHLDERGQLVRRPTQEEMTPNWLKQLHLHRRNDTDFGFVVPRDEELRLDDFQLATPEQLRRLGLIAALCEENDRLRPGCQQALDDAKLTALAEFAAGAGHEMNNPLAVISGRAQLLLRGEKDETRRADLALIKAQATRVHEMIADLMLFARPPMPKLDVEDVREVVRVAMEKLREAATLKDVQLLARLPVAMVSYDLDEALFGVAVRALVENAINAVDVGGKVVVEVEGFARMVRITVRDNGPGISPAERELIFDPYYSGRQAGRGLGMGLPKCWRIVQLHRGELTVGEAPGGGAEFVITLPIG